MDAKCSAGGPLSSPAAAQRCAEGAGLDSGAPAAAQSATPSIASPTTFTNRIRFHQRLPHPWRLSSSLEYLHQLDGRDRAAYPSRKVICLSGLYSRREYGLSTKGSPRYRRDSIRYLDRAHCSLLRILMPSAVRVRWVGRENTILRSSLDITTVGKPAIFRHYGNRTPSGAVHII